MNWEILFGGLIFVVFITIIVISFRKTSDTQKGCGGCSCSCSCKECHSKSLDTHQGEDKDKV